jgi:hypothetical protein
MQLTPFQRLFKRVSHFFFPVRGWKTRVQQFRAGKVVWEYQAPASKLEYLHPKKERQLKI